MNPLNRSKNLVYRPLLGALLLSGAGSAAHAGYLTIIDPANPTFTQALGINGSNTIVGYGNATIFDGFVLTLPSSFVRENFPAAAGGTQVIGVDAAGDTVGFYVDAAGLNHGFTDIGGTFSTVDQPGTSFNQLLGINQSGTEIAGYSSTNPAGDTLQEAFTLATSTTTYTDINALLVAAFGPNFNSQATGVNDGGWVVGFYQPTASTFEGFVDEGGVVSNIAFPGAADTQALGVNDLGEIVGDYTLADGNMYGFLDNGGVFTTIDPAGSIAVTANGINDSGHVVGFYTDDNGSTLGFATVPEPSTWAMMLAGFAGLGFLGYRKALKGRLAAR